MRTAPGPFSSVHALKDRHKGEDVAILCCGPSLVTHDLSKIDCLTMGVNRSYDIKLADYQVVNDIGQYRLNPKWFHANARRVIHTGALPVGTSVGRLDESQTQQTPFPLDLSKGVAVCYGGVPSVTYTALQVACWMGCKRALMLGLDLGEIDGKGHAYDQPCASDMARQNVLLKLALEATFERMPIWNVGSPKSRCTALPHLPFEGVWK